MNLSFAQGFDLALLLLAVLYLAFCQLKLKRIMPAVVQVMASPNKHNILARNKLKLWTSIPFSWLCFGYVMFRLHVFLASMAIDPVTTWVIPILIWIYGTYTLFFSITFGLVATYHKPQNTALQGVL